MGILEKITITIKKIAVEYSEILIFFYFFKVHALNPGNGLHNVSIKSCLLDRVNLYSHDTLEKIILCVKLPDLHDHNVIRKSRLLLQFPLNQKFVSSQNITIK